MSIYGVHNVLFEAGTYLLWPSTIILDLRSTSHHSTVPASYLYRNTPPVAKSLGKAQKILSKEWRIVQQAPG